LDPRKQDVLAVNRLFQDEGRAKGSGRFEDKFRRLKEVWGPQMVVVGGVPKNSRHAHVMIDADYHMKQVSHGLAAVPGVMSQIDRSLMEAEQALRDNKAMRGMGASAARFWFHVKNSPSFLMDDDIIRLRTCAVGVLTENQRSTADGRLFDSGEDDPDAKRFAEEFSHAFPQLARLIPVYGALENLYRLYALLHAMHMQRAVAQAGLDLEYLLERYPLRATKPMPDSLPGLVNGKEKRIAIRQGNMRGEIRLQPMVCGGVGMDMEVSPARLKRDSTMALARLRVAALKARPDSESLSWTVPQVA
jgi:hypothetical protein